MRIGVIGTGWVTEHHLNALKNIEGAQVAAIAGRNVGRAKELGEPWQANAYETALPMLQNESLDAAFILLPPHLHGELERACSEYVKGVLVEKPIAQSLQTAQEIGGYFKKAGTIVSVAYQNRYRQAVLRAKELFSQENGQGILARAWWTTEMPPPLWWRNFEQSGGQFVEQCTHLLDICRFTMGEIEDVSAYATRGFMTQVDDYSVDDAMVVNARFKSGALASFATGCFPEGGHDQSPGGGIGISLSSRAHRVSLEGWGFDGAVYSGQGETEEIPSEDNIFEIQNRAFLKAVETGDSSSILSSYEDGLKTLAATLAANESARHCGGAPVKVEI
ncbi:Gfo/Idh/MocA family protein [Pelagicoccus mobilis]|uniref:Gfo/Idh/MocA family oxidoreductase n=1 Tax=Pelagicoccus mobilis TaxID=415221 RepID=A0A934RW67_9BACT|nr:Gfo/Idh/MocA family oxidoreductase [Pelagicoccus mobilis]MBK1875911.1 Gfo/Idh/MocA family oxidoreductase [Pelagicoccus mobilis]